MNIYKGLYLSSLGKIYHIRKNHTKIFPYKCPLYNECKKEFVSKGALNYHIKNQHKNE